MCRVAADAAGGAGSAQRDRPGTSERPADADVVCIRQVFQGVPDLRGRSVERLGRRGVRADRQRKRAAKRLTRLGTGQGYGRLQRHAVGCGQFGRNAAGQVGTVGRDRGHGVCQRQVPVELDEPRTARGPGHADVAGVEAGQDFQRLLYPASSRVVADRLRRVGRQVLTLRLDQGDVGIGKGSREFHVPSACNSLGDVDVGGANR